MREKSESNVSWLCWVPAIFTYYKAYFTQLINKLKSADFLLRNLQSLSFSRFSQDFMELEGSLSCSQEPTTGSYPKPNESSPYHVILFL
jgi:hypothetical protein